MKAYILSMAVSLLAALAICSCSSAKYAAGGANPSEIVDSYTGSRNQLDLIVASEPIIYSIDISTPEGQAKLRKRSLVEAEAIAIREAVMQNRCAKLVDPQFTNLTKGKRVLRVTVYGFPAKYKNK